VVAPHGKQQTIEESRGDSTWRERTTWKMCWRGIIARLAGGDSADDAKAGEEFRGREPPVEFWRTFAGCAITTSKRRTWTQS